MVDNVSEKITEFVAQQKKNPEAIRSVMKVVAIYGGIYLLILFLMSFFEITRDDIRGYFNRFGYFTAVLFFISVLLIAMTPLPDAPLVATGILILGVPLGFIIIWSSLVTAGLINFTISKTFGRNFVKNNYPETTQFVDMFTKNNGIETIIIARMFTFVSFDMVSYAAGLTSMKYKEFLIATIISIFPIAINYTLIGAGIAAQDVFSMTISFGLSAVFAVGIGFLIRKWRHRHGDIKLPEQE